MALRDTRFDRVQTELDRLGCKDVRIAHIGAEDRTVFVCGDEAVTCPYALALHFLRRGETLCGDQVVWDLLLRVGRIGLQ